MQKNWWVRLALLFIIPGFLLTVSCAQQPVAPESGSGDASTSQAVGGGDAGLKGADVVDSKTDITPVVEPAIDREKEAFVSQDVLFEYDSAALTEMAQLLLREKAAWLKKNSAAHVIVEGHCDERGTTEYNLGLGERRAVSAREYLVALGISPSRLDTISYGEERPLDASKGEVAYRKNRRVHLSLK